jgi:exodeoxyribonuclease VII large subunit
MIDAAPVLSIAQLVDLIQDVVETNFVSVQVEGEISNFARPSSGHWYFTLKDDRAQLKSVMFRGRNRQVEMLPKDGMQVVCTGNVSVYQARGEVQLVVETLTPSGLGSLQAAFEAMKSRLANEGLFAEESKQLLPGFPRVIGIVTSPTGAAIHDILRVLRRRAPGLHVLLRPVRVQGNGAAEEISAAIADLNRQEQVDVMIVGRGGGSLEDLWAFNEEVVARAIAASKIPVISAVGHEVDITIADLAADLRAATPSAAAELVARSRQELETHLDHLIMRLQSRVQQDVTLASTRLDNLEGRMSVALRNVERQGDRIEALAHRLCSSMQGTLEKTADQIGQAAGRLDALSPLRQLQRGYVIASHDRDGVGVVSTDGLRPGDQLWLRFSKGRLKASVCEVES